MRRVQNNRVMIEACSNKAIRLAAVMARQERRKAKQVQRVSVSSKKSKFETPITSRGIVESGNQSEAPRLFCQT